MSAGGVSEAAAAERAKLVLRMSTLVEDDPKLAAEFARELGFDDTSRMSRLRAVCAAAEQTEICPPTKEQLHQAGLASALPFLGFGILDNAIMIVFGDVLDVTLCSALGFSTMAAAALGNTLSDGIGVFSGGVVEDLAAKAGFEAPPLSRAQQAMTATKTYERFGQLIGITIGCLIGMFPLWFIDFEKQEIAKREKSLESMYEHAVVAVEDILKSEAAMIVLVDSEKQELYSRSAAHHGDEEFAFRMPIGEGIIGRVAQTGQFLNIADLHAPESKGYYSPIIHDNFRGTGIAVKSVLAMPILGYDEEAKSCDKVLGVVCVINKKGQGSFSERDEDALAALCSHISTSLSFVHGEEHGFSHTLERCARALGTKGMRINNAQNQRVQDLYASVLVQVSSKMGVDQAELFTVSPSKEEVQVLARSGELGHKLNEDDRQARSFSECDLVARVTSTGKPCWDSEDGTSRLCCPLFDGNGSVIGALQLVDTSGSRIFSSEDVRFLVSVGGKFSLTMEGTGSSLARLLASLKGGAE